MEEKGYNKDGYHALANAIVFQAVRDFKSAYRKHLLLPEEYTYRHDVFVLRRFFRSGWFDMLSDCNGEVVLEKLEQEERRKAKGRVS
jgi:hypothetical protein